MKHLYLLAALTVAFAPYGTYKDMIWHVLAYVCCL
jgi:uncharacterized protein YaeQ